MALPDNWNVAEKLLQILDTGILNGPGWFLAGRLNRQYFSAEEKAPGRDKTYK